MAIEITRKLLADPVSGTLPFDTDLSLFARTTEQQETVSVTYSVAAHWNVRFAGPGGQATRTLTKHGVVLTPTPGEVLEGARLVRVSSGTPTTSVRITATVGNKRSSFLVQVQ